MESFEDPSRKKEKKEQKANRLLHSRVLIDRNRVRPATGLTNIKSRQVQRDWIIWPWHLAK